MKYILLILCLLFPSTVYANVIPNEDFLPIFVGYEQVIFYNDKTYEVVEKPNGDIFVYVEIYNCYYDEKFNANEHYEQLNFIVRKKERGEQMLWWDAMWQRYMSLPDYKTTPYVLPFNLDAQYIYMPICNYLYYVTYGELYFDLPCGGEPDSAYLFPPQAYDWF